MQGLEHLTYPTDKAVCLVTDVSVSLIQPKLPSILSHDSEKGCDLSTYKIQTFPLFIQN
jgi:hypothetical protein